MTNRYLSTALRRALEKTVKDARLIAEEGARDAIRRLGVADSKAPPYLNDDEKDLRRRLRAHARALGDAFYRPDESQETKRLVEAAAYAHWHRMLFARFLAERGLLRYPEYDVPVSLEDCRELAEVEGLADPWIIVERYAASMLPGVFRIDDPVLSIELDPVQTHELHQSVTGLDSEVFQAEDSLGWTYQFWRAAEKDSVNKSGVKIGAAELPAVTQLFTEPYMVRFLLHNTLGAWRAGKVLASDPMLAQSAADEHELRKACSLPDYSFDMLRFVRDGENGPWRPVAGTFPGWPKEAKAVTVLDPCCGSGHFLTEALAILAALRKAEDCLCPSDAVAAVLQENLYGLEIDGRCVQIAAFAVALTAWRIGGWQLLPVPQIAWVGAPPPLPRREFVALAGGDAELEYAFASLHDLFAQAPVLGTLLEASGVDIFEAEKLGEVERLLDPLLARVRRAEPEGMEGVMAARGMADAAMLLHKKYTLQATNVPYLGRGKQAPQLARYIEKRFGSARADLATAILARMRHLLIHNGTISAVTPQNWLFLGSYQEFRIEFAKQYEIDALTTLGPRAFKTISGEVVNAALIIVSKTAPSGFASYAGINCNDGKDADEKEAKLASGRIAIIAQEAVFANESNRIAAVEINSLPSLSQYADVYVGFQNGDTPRWVVFFWEIAGFYDKWEPFHATPDETADYSGMRRAVPWGRGAGPLARSEQALIKGREAWGKSGVLIRQTQPWPTSIYNGALYDQSSSVIVPKNSNDLLSVLAFCRSSKYSEALRSIANAMKFTNSTFTSVPFDAKLWRENAKGIFPDGLPAPQTDDPTQWIFHGHPAATTAGMALHVGLARLCGHRWPAERDPNMHLSDEARGWIARSGELPPGDNDGLLGVAPVAGERALVDRLRTYLAAAFNAEWSDALECRLVAEADETLDKKAARDGSLEAWVRDRAFRQHCNLFGQRPFLWHISDGLRDGFSVFAHYHRFDQANLRKLAYTLLGDWLARAKAENNVLRYERGRELQQKLEKILEGEMPYDIFVRWKSLAELPIGWDPDLDDGVRQNIRPFILADVLNHNLSKILKDKDRGKDVASAPWYDQFNGERRNDHHTTLAEKRTAHEATVERVEAAQ